MNIPFTSEFDPETLALKIDWYEKQLSPYCNKRSRNKLSIAAEIAITDVRSDCGDLLDPEYCLSIGIAPPEQSDQYTDVEALHLALVTTDYYPDMSEVTGKFTPEAIYAALGITKLEIARQYFSKQNYQKVTSILTEVKQFRWVLAGEVFARPKGDYNRNLESDTKAEHISRERTRAVQKSKRFVENKARQKVVIQYYETIKKILTEDSPTQFTDDELLHLTIQSINEVTGNKKARKSLQALPLEDRQLLSILADDLIQSSEEGVDEAYIRRCLKDYLSIHD
jgi:hypothetical protein